MENVNATDISCNLFNSCSAPLCPLNQNSLVNAIWYRDEESCQSAKYKMIPWIRRQRKIVKRSVLPDLYFTHNMLNRNFIIKKGLKGLDPNEDETIQLERWMKRHPEKKLISEEQRNQMREKFKRAIS